MTKRTVLFSIRGSLWFIPGLWLMGAIGSAVGLVALDQRFDPAITASWPPILMAGPEGARHILSAIASSMMTVTGVVFSITIVTLSLAANQYSSRVLRSFMRDRLNQFVLGVLVAVFVYSLLVLQVIRSEEGVFVPQLALWFGILLALVSLGFLIAFIHHTAVSIQASEIVSRLTTETLGAIAATRKPVGETRAAAPAGTAPSERRHRRCVPATQSGYIQDVDTDALFALACAHGLLVRVEHAVGDFVIEGRPLATVSGDSELDEKLTRRVQGSFGISSYRTVEQDPAFGIRQIVDVALKALSPGVNDTTTAIHCIDYLGVILHHVARTATPDSLRCEDEEARLIMEHPSSVHLVDIALHEIRQNARANVAILLRLARLMRQLSHDVRDPEWRQHLEHHLSLVAKGAERDVPSPEDRAVVAQAVQRAQSVRPANASGR